MLPDWLPWLLQVNDSQFPSGGYAHSHGLEELVQAGHVADAAGLERFLREQLVPALREFEAPFLAEAHRCAAVGDLDGLERRDWELNGWRLPAELRAASVQIGSRRLALVQKLAGDGVAAAYAARGAPNHHLIVCALEMRAASPETAACAFAYQSISGHVMAAMKLLRLGQERAQGLIRSTMMTMVEAISGRCATSGDAVAGWFNPLVEIASMRHASAHERIFIS